jgi:thiamine-phosphate pyrophosphorylase
MSTACDTITGLGGDGAGARSGALAFAQAAKHRARGAIFKIASIGKSLCCFSAFATLSPDRYERGMTIDSCQLYLISPLDVGGDFPQQLIAALDAGPIAAFQFRVQNMNQHEAAKLAEPLRAICEERDVAFMVANDIALAKRLRADGVHFERVEEGDAKEARSQLGVETQIGVSCFGSRHLAMEAGEAGAAYVSFGAFYPTQTVEVSEYVDPDMLTWWHDLFELSSVAIGGIKPDNARTLIDAGADFIAVCSGVWQHPEGPAAAIKAYMAVIEEAAAADAAREAE